MASRNTLERLRRLDSSSPKYHNLLGQFLSGEEYKLWVPALRGEDLLRFVDYLDSALDSLDPATFAARKCLCELIHICSTRTILPTSFALPQAPRITSHHPIASGGSGDLYEGILNGSRVYVKCVRVSSKDHSGKAIKAAYQEAVVWKHLRHQNIVPLLGVTSAPLQLISEWMPGGDLTEYIKGHQDADRIGLLSHVAEGLQFLHSHNVVHGSIMCSNILVDDAGRARITGFGQATVIQMDSTQAVSDDQGHTARWTAPEVLKGNKTYSKASDIFSFAMVVIEVFTGAIPFGSTPSTAATLAIMNGKRPPRPPHLAFTDQLWAITGRCWDQDPHLRPQISEVLHALLTPEPPAWKRLIRDRLSTDERISLITSTFSDHDKAKVVRRLSRDDAQALIDAIYEVLDSLPQHIRGKCLRSLFRICGRHALLPRRLSIPLCHDPKEMPLCRGGFSDVWKGRHEGREVAIKVLRVYLTNDLERITRRFCKEAVAWKALRHPNVLPLVGVTMVENQFGMVSQWMENGNINEFAKAHTNANRVELLTGVAAGLTYMHRHGIVHGDLKGPNILVNNDGRACLADFGLLTITSDLSSFLSSRIEGGTTRWMSPELLSPEQFGFTKSLPTKASDCYALGMVIYEVLSGQMPFASFGGSVVIRKVLDGERPARPQGELIADSIWGMVQSCWKPQPGERTSAKTVLLGLEGDPPGSITTLPDADGDMETDIDCRSETTAGASSLSITLCEKGLPDSGATSPMVSPDGYKPPPGPPQGNRSKGKWVYKLKHSARKMFKAGSRGACGR